MIGFQPKEGVEKQKTEFI